MPVSLKKTKKLTPELVVISQLFPQKLGREFYYQHLPLCIVDAVFSIGIRYSTVQRVVQNFCQFSGWNCYRSSRSLPPTSQQKSISDLLNLYNLFRGNNGINFTNVAVKVFNNRCRTVQRKNGMLKAEAVYRFAQILQNSGIEYFQDLNNSQNFPGFLDNVKKQIQKIPGLKSGIAFDYFLMLAGNCNTVKPDRMVKRYLAWLYCCSENKTDSKALLLMKDLLNRLKKHIPNLTLRQLDYAIWNFQRKTLRFGCRRNVMTLHPHRTGGLLTVQIHSSNQKEVNRCFNKLINFLEKNGWKISNFKVSGLMFRVCPYGTVEIPVHLFNNKIPILVLGNRETAQFPPSEEEILKNFPDSVWSSDLKEEELISEIEKAVSKQTSGVDEFREE